MTFIEHCFNSEILQTVNSTSSLNVVHLAKNDCALRFEASIQKYFRHYHSLGGGGGGGEAVTNTVMDSNRFCIN